MPATTTEAVTRAMSGLREALTALSIELLHAEDFERAQVLTQSAREVKELEGRIQRVLGTEPHPLASTTASGAIPSKPRRDFPRFYRQGELVVKLALRRDRKTTYEQRCPRPEYLEVMEAVQQVARAGDAFEAPQIKDRVRCPDYQVYLVLALLENLGYLESPRRGVHRLQKGGGSAWAEEVWRQIPQDDSLAG